MEYATPITTHQPDLITNTIVSDPITIPQQPLEIDKPVKKIMKLNGLIHIESLEHRQELIDNSDILIVKYGADWCGPCKTSEPLFRTMANEDSSGKCIYTSEDVDDDFGEQAEPVRSIPAFHIYKNGNFERAINGCNLKGVAEIIDMLKRE
jgi:thiol-disulfide isomerase/thioredoxin